MKLVKNKNINLTTRIYLILAIFLVIIIGVIWLFQIVLLDPMYQNATEREIKRLIVKSEPIVETYESISALKDGKEDLTTELDQLTERSNINYFIISKTGENIELITKSTRMRNGSLDFYLDNENNLAVLWDKALKSSENPFKLYFDEEHLPFDDVNPPLEEGMLPEMADEMLPQFEKNAEIVYGLFGQIDSDNAYLIVFNSELAPVNATKATLTSQLIFITIGVLLFGIILALIMSKMIASPIRNLNEQAKNLPNLDDNQTFKVKGYPEVVELSDTLNYALQEIKKADQLQKEFLANVSHELRTPLTLISGYTELMKDIPEEMNQTNLEIIHAEALRLTRLVNDVIDLSKL